MNQNDIHEVIKTLWKEYEMDKLQKSDQRRVDFIESITDRVFLYISQNPNLMQKYIMYVASLSPETAYDKQWAANMQIGRFVALYPGFANKQINGRDIFCACPISPLILTYTKHVEI